MLKISQSQDSQTAQSDKRDDPNVGPSANLLGIIANRFVLQIAQNLSEIYEF
jgi:hypothetical protein